MDNQQYTGTINFFDILKNILSKGDDFLDEHPDFKKNFSTYMLIRYLSMREDLFPFALIIQQMVSAKISDMSIYKFAYTHIPKTRSTFIKYIKKSNKESNEQKISK